MQVLKNLIARRRPSGGVQSLPSEPHEDIKPSDAAEGVADDAVLAAVQLQSDAQDLERDLNAAQAARDHVPTPVRPKPHQFPDWSKRRKTRPKPAVKTVDIATPPPVKQKKIWDLEAEQKAAPADHTPVAQSPETNDLKPRTPRVLAKPPPASDRAKTRLLGFNADGPAQDIFGVPPAAGQNTDPQFPIGWLVVMEGPGRGASFTLTAGLSTLGRDADQTVSLDFGDASISRQQHVAIAYDEAENRAFVGHGGKSNIVRHNGKPLLTTEDLADGDRIRIGKTELKFVAFCNADFSWADEDTKEPIDG